jgi:hypothetical protein
VDVSKVGGERIKNLFFEKSAGIIWHPAIRNDSSVIHGGGMVHENTSCKTGQFVFRTKSDTRVALFCAIRAKVAFRLDAVNALIVADFGEIARICEM